MFWFEKNFIPIPPKYAEDAGYNFATELAKKTQFISLMFNISGWVFIMLGILLGVAGSVLGTDSGVVESDAWSRLFSQRGLICNTFAVIIAGVGKQFLERAKASAKLASIATTAISSSSLKKPDKAGVSVAPDREAYDMCVLAKADWIEGRIDNTQLKAMLNNLGQDESTSI